MPQIPLKMVLVIFGVPYSTLIQATSEAVVGLEPPTAGASDITSTVSRYVYTSAWLHVCIVTSISICPTYVHASEAIDPYQYVHPYVHQQLYLYLILYLCLYLDFVSLVSNLYLCVYMYIGLNI